MKSLPILRFPRICAATALAALSLCAAARAQTTYDWFDTAPDGNWKRGADGARWTGGLWDEPPAGNILRFNNNHQLTMTNNVTGYNVHQLIFGSANTANRTIGGNALSMNDWSGADPKIENQSTGSHTITLNLTGDSNDPLELNPTSGDLTFNGTINNNGSAIFVYGDNSKGLFLNGVVSGSGSLVVKQYSKVISTAAHTYSGNTYIDEGEFWIGENGTVSGTIDVGASAQPANVAKLFISDTDGGTTVANNITVQTGNTDTRFIGGLNTSGTNTYSGTITLNSGLILESASGGNLNVSGVISGANAIYNKHTGTLLLSGNNTFSGGSYLSANSTTLLGHDKGLGTGTIEFSYGVGTTQVIGSSSSTARVVSNNLNIYNNAVIFGQASGGTGALTFSGNISIGADGSPVTRTLTVNNASTTLSGIVSGGANNALTKAGTGTLTLTNANSYSGGTTINAGTINATNSSALGSGNVSVAAGGKLVFGANNTTIANNITLNGTTTNGAIYSNQPGAGVTTNLTGQITLNATSNVSSNWNDKTLQLSGKITGVGGLDFVLQPGQVGGRYLITGATNDYAGATSVTGNATGQWGYTGQAMLYLGATNALPTTTALTLNYADLYLNGQAQTLASISGSGNFSVQNGSTNAATLTLGSGNTTSTFSGTIKNNGISVNNTAASPATVTGTVALTKIGTGTLTLSGNNTYTGATTISAGTLKLGSATGMSSASTLDATGGVFDLNGFNATVTAVGVGNAAGTITNSASGSGTNTLTITNYTVNLASLITDGATAKTGILFNNAGSIPWLSNANNTFSGGLTIANGGGNTRMYQLGAVTNTLNGTTLTKSNFGTGTVYIGANGSTAAAQLMLSSGSVYNNIVVNAASYLDGGRAAFRIDGTVALYGTLTAGASDISLSNGSGTGSATAYGQLTGTNGLLLNPAQGTAFTLTLTNNSLVNTNNYSGNTTISANTTLALGAANQIANGVGKGNLINNGTFSMGGFSETINGLTGNGTIDGNGATLTVGDNNATSTFSGVIKNTAGTLALTKNGTGILTLSGNNTYTGATTINAGTIQIGHASGLGVGGNITFAGGGLQYGSGMTADVSSRLKNSASAILIDTNSNNVTFTNAVDSTNSGGLTKNGTGTLTLSGNNTYTGATAINSGTLTVGNGSTSSSYTTASGAVLNLGSSPSVNFSLLGNGTVNITGGLSAGSNALTIGMGSGGLIDIKSGASLSYGFGNDPWTSNLADLNVVGTIYGAGNNIIVNALTGNSTTFSMGGGTIVVGVNNGNGTYTGTLARNYADAHFRKEGSGTQTLNGTINLGATGTITQIGSGNLVINGATQNGSVTQNGTGTLTLAGNNTYTGTTTISAGTLEIGAAGRLGGGSYSANIANSGTFLYSGTNDQVLSGQISGVGALTKSGAGNLTLSGNNTYTGTSTISAGTLKAGSATGISSASTLNATGGVFDLNGYNATVAAVGVGNAAGTITNSASGSGTNTLTITNYTVNLASLITDGATAKTAVTLYNNGGATPLSNANNTFSGGLTIANGGTNGRLYQGSVTNTLVNGTLTKSNLGTGTVYIGANGSTAGAQLQLSSGSVYNNIIVNAATYLDGGSAAFRIDGTVALYGTLTAGASDISLSSGGSGSATAYGQLTGTNGLLLKAPSTSFTLTLANTANATNDYSGNTTISDKTTLVLGAADQIANGAGKGNLIINSGTFNMAGFSETINGLTGNGTLDGMSGTPTLTVGDNNATSTFSGVMKNTAGTLALTKTGSGTLTLSGNNTYGGVTTLNVGTISMGHANALGTTGNITFGGGALQYGSGITVDVSLRLKNSASAILLDTNNNNVTFASAVDSTNSGGLTKNGTGTLTLSGNNTYTGATTLNAGTLRVGNNSAFGASSVVVNSSSVIIDSAAGTSYTLSNNITLNTRGTIGATAAMGNLTLGGIISGTGDLKVDTTAGATTLTGLNTFTGNLIVDRATEGLSFNSIANAGVASAVGAGSSISLGVGASTPTFTYTGNTAASSNRSISLNGGGAYIISRNAPLTLSGNVTSTSQSLVLQGNAGGGANFNELSGNYSGGGSLNVQTSTGDVWKISGNNTYTGITYSQFSGTTIAGHSNAFGSTVNGTQVTQNSQILLADNISVGAEALTLNSAAFGSWNGQTGAALRSYSGNNSWAGAITLGQATTIATNSGAGLTLSGGIGGTFNLFFNSSGDTIASGNITIGTGTLTKSGAGNLTLSGNNTYTGTTTISAGTLQIGGAGLLGGGSYSANISNSGALVYSSTANQTLSGNITGAGSLTKNNTGTLTLLGTANTYNGATTVSGGTLQLAGNITSSALTLNSGGVISVGTNSTITTVGKANAASLTINAGSGYALTIGNVNASVAGTDYDQITASGALTLNNTAASPFTVYLNGTPTGWNNGSIYSWDIISAASLSGVFNSGNFTTNFDSFGIAAGNRTGTWSFLNPSGGTIRLTYTALAGNSTWNTGTGNWNTGSNWTENAVPINNNNLVFTGAGGTATNNIGNGTLTTVTDITFASGAGAYTLNASVGSAGASGGTPLALIGTITNESSNLQTINTDLAINIGSTINATSGNITIGGAISGSAGITKTGNNALTLSGSNTYNGTTALNSGTLNINSATALGNGTFTITGGTIDNTSGAAITLTNNNTQNWNGDFTFAGTNSLNLGTGNVTMSASRTVTVNAGNLTVRGVVSGAGFGLTKNGSGTLILNASTAFTGAKTVNAGTLRLEAPGTVTIYGANSTININNGSTLQLGFQSGFASNPVFQGMTINIDSTGGATVVNDGLNALIQGGNWMTINTNGGAQNQLTSANNGFYNDQGVNGGIIFNVASGSNSTADMVMAASGGTYAITKNGTGRLLVTSSPTLRGITINNGTLEFGGSSTPTFSASLAFTNNGTFSYNSTASSTISQNITGTGNLTKSNTSTLTLSGTNSYTGLTTITNGTLAIGNNMAIGAIAGTGGNLSLGTGFTLTTNASSSTTFSGVISGAGSLTKAGTGALTLNGTNTYTGGTTVNAGTVSLGHANGLGTSGNITFTGGGLQYGSGITTDISSRIKNSTGAILVDTNGNNVTFASALDSTNSSGFTKNGAGVLSLSGNNTYSGSTTINSGTLEIASTGLLGGGSYSGNIANNGALIAGSNSNQILSGIISGTGALTKNGSGTLTLTGSNSFSGSTTLNTGTLVISHANAAGTGTLTQSSGASLLKIDTTGTIANTMSVYNVQASQSATLSGAITVNNASFDVDSGDTLTLSGAVSGSGGVTKNGTGTLVLSGSNTYAAATTVNAGTLNAAHANALGSNTTVQIYGGSLLVTADDAINGKNLTLASTANGSAAAASLAFSGTYNGTAGSLTLNADSIIDLGTGSVAVHFSELAMGIYNLAIYNWTGTTLWGGGTGNNTDQFYVDRTVSSNELNRISFYSGFSTNSFVGTAFQLSGGSFNQQIIPVPEPEAYATAIILLLGAGWWMRGQKKRFARDDQRPREICGKANPART